MEFNEDDFYKNMHTHVGSLQQVLAEPACFADIPDSWHVIITDVKNSTTFFEKGKQQLIHLAATGSIVACLNIARKHDVEIPFFFGGDGSTIVVPEKIKDSCMHALKLHQERCTINFGFHLRVGSRNVGHVRKNCSVLKIAKFKRNELHILPVIIGDGLKIAEREIKDKGFIQEPLLSMPFNLDLSGMECKWDKIETPLETQEILSLIINAVNEDAQHAVLSMVLDVMESVYGAETARNPLSTGRLKMFNSLTKLRSEVQLKLGNVTYASLLKSYVRSVFKRYFIRHTSDGRRYLEDMVNLTETLMIDGSINTVITGTIQQREELLCKLDDLERENKIVYGYHKSSRSVLSCSVTITNNHHIHFLDGEDGGYTRASKILKQKLVKTEL